MQQADSETTFLWTDRTWVEGRLSGTCEKLPTADSDQAAGQTSRSARNPREQIVPMRTALADEDYGIEWRRSLAWLDQQDGIEARKHADPSQPPDERTPNE